jgi:drug/metabolite transporter (DMT)-like permease
MTIQFSRKPMAALSVSLPRAESAFVPGLDPAASEAAIERSASARLIGAGTAMDGAASAPWPAAHPYLLLTFVALFWAGNVVLGRAISEAIPPITLNVMRWTIAFGLLMPVAWPQLAGKGQVVREHFIQLLLLAVPSTAVYNTFIYLGTRTTSAANAGLIVGTMPIAILVLAALAGEERLTARRAAGIAISFAGVVFVIARGSFTVLHELSFSSGDLFIIGSVISWAVYSILLRRFAIPLGAFALLAVLSAIGLALCIPFCAWELWHGERIVWSPGTLAAIIYVGIFPSVIATIFWNGAVAKVGAGTAGIFTNLIPVFAIILAVVLLSESISPFQLVGMGLIFIAIWLVSERPVSSEPIRQDSIPSAATSRRAKCRQ